MIDGFSNIANGSASEEEDIAKGVVAVAYTGQYSESLLDQREVSLLTGSRTAGLDTVRQNFSFSEHPHSTYSLDTFGRRRIRAGDGAPSRSTSKSASETRAGVREDPTSRDGRHGRVAVRQRNHEGGAPVARYRAPLLAPCLRRRRRV